MPWLEHATVPRDVDRTLRPEGREGSAGAVQGSSTVPGQYTAVVTIR